MKRKSIILLSALMALTYTYTHAQQKSLYAKFPEGWETHKGSRKADYPSASDVFPSGEWLLQEAYSIKSNNVENKNGKWAVMMRGGAVSAIEMNFDLSRGASKFSFYCGAATQNPNDGRLPITVTAEYSTDAGKTWQSLGDALTVSDQQKKYFKEYDLDIKGPVRFRIKKDASRARLFVDDIAVYQN